MILVVLFGIGSMLCTVLSWFAIVITGKMPKGLFDFILKSDQLTARFNAYISLLTDEYPAV